MAEPPSYGSSITDDPPCYGGDDTMSDEQWELLKKRLGTYDTIILMDDSTSMRVKTKNNPNLTRWEMAKEVLLGLSDKMASLDKDGFDLFLLNDKAKELRNINGPKKIEDLREMMDSVSLYPSTPLGTRLGEILQEYLYNPLQKKEQKIKDEEKPDKSVWNMLRGKKGKENKEKNKVELEKGINILIITDGAPYAHQVDEVKILKAVLNECAKTVQKRLGYDHSNSSPVGIQLVQIGDDEAATQFLNDLDGDFKEGVLADVVDTIPVGSYKVLTPQILLKVMIGGVDRNIDRK